MNKSDLYGCLIKLAEKVDNGEITCFAIAWSEGKFGTGCYSLMHTGNPSSYESCQQKISTFEKMLSGVCTLKQKIIEKIVFANDHARWGD